MMVALLHSNGQLRTEKDGNIEKGGQKPALQQKTTDDGYIPPHPAWSVGFGYLQDNCKSTADQQKLFYILGSKMAICVGDEFDSYKLCTTAKAWVRGKG